jgi:transposase
MFHVSCGVLVILRDHDCHRMRVKIPVLTEAMAGRFREHHAFLARLHLGRIDSLTASIAELTARIEVVIEPFREALTLLVTIPGVSRLVADVIIAETGGDMNVFPTAGHLASWAGTTPGHHESAGRSRSTKTRPGNSYLKAALGIAAMAAARSNGTTFRHSSDASLPGAATSKPW